MKIILFKQKPLIDKFHHCFKQFRIVLFVNSCIYQSAIELTLITMILLFRLIISFGIIKVINIIMISMLLISIFLYMCSYTKQEKLLLWLIMEKYSRIFLRSIIIASVLAIISQRHIASCVIESEPDVETLYLLSIRVFHMEDTHVRNHLLNNNVPISSEQKKFAGILYSDTANNLNFKLGKGDVLNELLIKKTVREALSSSSYIEVLRYNPRNPGEKYNPRVLVSLFGQNYRSTNDPMIRSIVKHAAAHTTIYFEKYIQMPHANDEIKARAIEDTLNNSDHYNLTCDRFIETYGGNKPL